MTPPTHELHLADEAIHDWIDGRLDARAHDAVARHCAGCPTCAGRLAALERVVAAARQVPASIAPPDPSALERAIAAAIAASTIPSTVPSLAPRRRAPAWRIPAAIAAGIAVVATTAVVTARLVRPAAPPVVAMRDTAPSVGAARPASLPSVDVAALRTETDRTLATLRAAAVAGDEVLAAETLRVLERSLRTIDAAIAEADAALARDPNNAALAALLAGTYERKRELVRRGALLGARS